MKVQYGKGKTVYGPGVQIDLTVNGQLCEGGQVYVDPSGAVVYKGKGFSGRGKKRRKAT
jgi:hypothetical protein